MNKKTIIALIALIAVVGLMAGIYVGTREKPTPTDPTTQSTGTVTAPSGSDSTETQPQYAHYFTLVIVHSDGKEKTVEIQTDREFLAEALLDENLIVESDSPGLYTTVDGEVADWNVNKAYWNFLIGDEYALEGMNTTRIQNGATYKLVYTLG